MDKQKKLKIALPVLIIIMAFVWGPVIVGGSKGRRSTRAGTVLEGLAPHGDSAGLIVLARSHERKKARTSFRDWGRNPFMISEAPKASVLEGVLWDPQAPKAIINGNIFGIGDQAGSGEIVDIQPDSVTIKSGDTEKEYRLGP